MGRGLGQCGGQSDTERAGAAGGSCDSGAVPAEFAHGRRRALGNAYAEGLSDAAREFTALTPDTPGAEQAILDLFTLDATRAQYEGGTADPELIAPEGWLLDQHFLDLPGRRQAQLALAYDYKSNIAAYPAWQAWLRKQQPPTLITWGSRDPFFPEPGARAYLRDLPDAELHLFETGHFALEDHLPEIAPLINAFLARTRA